MAPLKVLVGMDLEERYLEAIDSVHSDVQVIYAPDVTELGRPRRRPPLPVGFPVVEAEAALPEAEVILAFSLSPDKLKLGKNLRWVHLPSAGADLLPESLLLDTGIVVTTSSGVSAVPIAEWIVCTMLMFSKHMPLALRNRQDRVWRRYTPFELNMKTLGIVGLGHIGTALAHRAKAMGMTVLASRRGTSTGPLPENVDLIYSREDLHDLLGSSDFVALCVPLTRETERLIGKSELRAMRSSAYLINISRGRVVDETALIRALKEDWIAGAALDVFEQEPLPPESEIWDLQNVIMTPHAAGLSEQFNDRRMALFCENLRRYIAGESLLNVVDNAKGY